MNQPLLVGLDIGSSHIRFATGRISSSPGHDSLSLSIIGAIEAPSEGVSKGVVNALEDAVASISSCLEQAERQVGSPIEEVVLGIGGTHISVIGAKGVVGVSRPDREIRREDIARVMEDAKGVANPANVEIIHVLPHGFAIDGQMGIKDPIGMHGIRIEASAHLITGVAGNVRNLTKCVFRTGLDVASLAFGALAGSYVVTSNRERDLGACIVNIGASTTSVVLFEDGDLIHAAVLPIGSDHITSDIAIGLRTSLETAEKIKTIHGSATTSDFGKRDEIDLKDFGGEESEVVSLKYVAEIIRARTEEIFEKVEEELRKADRSGLLPAGAILTGGGARLHGIVDVAKDVLRLPASIGTASHIETTVPEYARDPAFSTAIGLVQWGFEELRKDQDFGGGKGVLRSGSEAFGKVGSTMKKLFKSFIP